VTDAVLALVPSSEDTVLRFVVRLVATLFKFISRAWNHPQPPFGRAKISENNNNIHL
jgi:hypothetical protein